MPFITASMASFTLSLLAVTGDAFRNFSHTMYFIDGKGHKLKLRRSKNYFTNQIKSKPCVALKVNTYTHT